MNGLVYSRHGALNTEMAGGDLDGDLVQASWLHHGCVSPGMRTTTVLSCRRKDAVSALCQIALWAALIQFLEARQESVKAELSVSQFANAQRETPVLGSGWSVAVGFLMFGTP